MWDHGAVTQADLGLGHGEDAGILLFDCSILLFFFFSAGLAEKRVAKVDQVIGQGAPQRHAFDFHGATYRERHQPAIRS